VVGDVDVDCVFFGVGELVWYFMCGGEDEGVWFGCGCFDGLEGGVVEVYELVELVEV